MCYSSCKIQAQMCYMIVSQVEIVVKNPPANAGDSREAGSVPETGRSPGEGIGYPFQYSWASLMSQTVKNLPQGRRPGFHPWVGKIPGEGKGYSLQYSGLEDSMDRGAWSAPVHGVTESQTK